MCIHSLPLLLSRFPCPNFINLLDPFLHVVKDPDKNVLNTSKLFFLVLVFKDSHLELSYFIESLV